MYKKRSTIISFLLLQVVLTSCLFAQDYQTAEARDFETAHSADTFFVFGTHSFGILNLPIAPNNIPYLINNDIESETQRIVLPMGRHRISWHGGIGYMPIDTFVDVRAGEILNLRLSFVERQGTIFIETEPDEARIFLNSDLAGVGTLFRDIKAGEHRLAVSAHGFHGIEQTITVFPNRLTRFHIQLPSTHDRDGDGFPDSVDLCPDVFGIYRGCPRPPVWHELKELRSFWRDYLSQQPFTIEVLAFAFQHRIATEPIFRELIGLFNDGPVIGTNHRGFSAFNKIWIGHRQWIMSLEYGQGFAGSRYRKSFDIPVDIDFDNGFWVEYDRFGDLEPTMILRSYSGQIGFRAGNEILSLAILTGYQREKIMLNNITERNERGRRTLSSRSARNDTWITSVRAALSPIGENFHPTYFIELSITPILGDGDGSAISRALRPETSGWVGFRGGIIIPWRLQRND
ncbi:MAG: PEGA domain-containing protein [Chitinivibrionia bacterium]|nr:PEGA domain-containing protein [Chitinivibrionia bacterium]